MHVCFTKCTYHSIGLSQYDLSIKSIINSSSFQLTNFLFIYRQHSFTFLFHTIKIHIHSSNCTMITHFDCKQFYLPCDSKSIEKFDTILNCLSTNSQLDLKIYAKDLKYLFHDICEIKLSHYR